MKKSVFIIILVLFISGYSLEQTKDIQVPDKEIRFYSNQIDSLPYFIKSGKVEFRSQCLQNEHYIYFFKPSGPSFSGKALHLTEKNRLPYIHVCFFMNKAYDFYLAKNYSEAERYWYNALEIAVTYHFDFEELHSLRPALNNNFFHSGNYAAAMKISSEGLTSSEKIKDTDRMAHFNNVIGYIHMKQKDFAEAEQYFSNYLQLAREMKNKYYEGHALYDLADLSITRKDYDKAISYLNQSMDAYRFLADSDKKFNMAEREAYISNKIAESWKLKGNLPEALQFIKTAVKISKEKIGVNDYDEASYYINAGDIYNRSGQPDSAVANLRTGLSIAKKAIHREYVRDAYEQLALGFAKKFFFDSAYFYQSLFLNLNDSLLNESNQKEIFLREANLKIERNQIEQQAALQRQRIWRNIILAIAVLMMLIGYLLYNRYRLKQKNKYQAELNRQQQEILHTTISVQDQERKRIAEDLHDGLGSILSAAKLKLSAIEEDSIIGEKEKMQDTLLLIDEAVSEMKNIAYNMMPATLSRLGLTAALQNLFNRISMQSGLKINYTTHGFTERLNESTEVSVYRIILESINNVVKHAHAKNVTVQLVKYPDYINITIEDDGNGFELQTDGSFSGNGLNNIASRVKNMNGTLNIDTKPGSGTTILVDIPYSY